MKYMMSAKELARLAVIKGAIGGDCTVRRTARKRGLSKRRVKPVEKAARERGDGTVIHGNSGRRPANVTGEVVREKILALKKSGPCNKANFTRFRELPEERERITISYVKLRKKHSKIE
jgi:hypothetical protein